jgi:hypothetical protein
MRSETFLVTDEETMSELVNLPREAMVRGGFPGPCIHVVQEVSKIGKELADHAAVLFCQFRRGEWTIGDDVLRSENCVLRRHVRLDRHRLTLP